MDNKININKQDQWKVMSAILDRELPIETERKRPLFWIWFLLGFVVISGTTYYIQTHAKRAMFDTVDTAVATNTYSNKHFGSGQSTQKLNASNTDHKGDKDIHLNTPRSQFQLLNSTEDVIDIKPSKTDAPNVPAKANKANISKSERVKSDPRTMSFNIVQDKSSGFHNVTSGSSVISNNEDSQVSKHQDIRTDSLLIPLEFRVLESIKSNADPLIVQSYGKINAKHEVKNPNVLNINIKYLLNESNTVNNYCAAVTYDYWRKGKFFADVGVGYNFLNQSKLHFYGYNQRPINIDNGSQPTPDSFQSFDLVNYRVGYISIVNNVGFTFAKKLGIEIGYELGRKISTNVTGTDAAILTRVLDSDATNPKWSHTLTVGLRYQFNHKISVSANMSHNLNNTLFDSKLEENTTTLSSQFKTVKAVNTLFGVGLQYRIE